MKLTIYNLCEKEFEEIAKKAFELYLNCPWDHPENNIKYVQKNGEVFDIPYSIIYGIWRNHLKDWTGVEIDDRSFILTRKDDEFHKYALEIDGINNPWEIKKLFIVCLWDIKIKMRSRLQ